MSQEVQLGTAKASALDMSPPGVVGPGCKKRLSTVGLMLGRRRRRRDNINPTLGQLHAEGGGVGLR